MPDIFDQLYDVILERKNNPPEERSYVVKLLEGGVPKLSQVGRSHAKLASWRWATSDVGGIASTTGRHRKSPIAQFLRIALCPMYNCVEPLGVDIFRLLAVALKHTHEHSDVGPWQNAVGNGAED